MSTPAQKLKWDDLDPVDAPAAEANVAAARVRVRAAVKEDKDATRAGTQAGIGYKLSWDDLTPAEGMRQPSRVTSSGRQPLAWNQSGDTSPIRHAPHATDTPAAMPAATSADYTPLTQPGASFQSSYRTPTERRFNQAFMQPSKPLAPSTLKPVARVSPRAIATSVALKNQPKPENPNWQVVEPGKPMSETDAANVRQWNAAGEQEKQDETRREVANQAISAHIGGQIGLPGLRLPRVLTEGLADFTGGLEHGIGKAIEGVSKPGPFQPAASIPGVRDVLQATAGKLGSAMQSQGQEARAIGGNPEGVLKDIFTAAGEVVPALAARNPMMVGALAYTQAKGEGLSEEEAIEHGLKSAATVGAMGKAANVVGRAVPGAGVGRAVTRVAGRAAANLAIPSVIDAPEKIIAGESPIPTKREVMANLPQAVGFAVLPHPVAEKPRVVRAPLALSPAPPEAVTSQSRGPFVVSPTGEAVSTQPVARAPRLEPIPTQPLPLNRYQQRAQGGGRLESPVRPAPTSPAPSQAAQRGDFETGLEGMTAPRVLPSEPSLKPAPATKSATSPAVENQSDQSTRADVAAPTYTVGDHLTSPTGKTFRVEAVSGDQTHIRAIKHNGQPAGRTIPLRPDDVAQFERAEVKPITVRAVSGPRTVNPETHSLTDAISILGFDGTTQEGKDLAAYVQKRPGTINNTRLSNGEKRGIDNHLIPALQDLGYDVTDTNDLLDKVRSQKPVYSQHYYEAQGERDIQSHLAAEHQTWLDDKPDSQGQSESDMLFRAGKSPEFVSLLNRLHDPDATAEDEARFYEEATRHQKLSDDLTTGLIETATARRNEQGRNQHSVRDTAQSATQARESGQRPQERGAELRPAEGEGDVNAGLGDIHTRQETAAAELGRTRQTALSGMAVADDNGTGTRGGTETSGLQPQSTDHLSRVQSIFDTLKDESRTTGRRLQDIVEDRIAQRPLPGFESQALSPDDATLLRQMAARAPNRPPVQEQQSPLLDTSPTVESRQAQTAETEEAQSRGAANTPLFEGIGRELTIAPEGKTYKVIWADGRAVQYFESEAEAKEFASDPEREANPPALVDTPKGARVNKATNGPSETHHSELQPRNDQGQFDGPPDYTLTPEKIKPPTGTPEGKAVSLLHTKAGGNFFNHPAVKKALGLDEAAPSSETHNALRDLLAPDIEGEQKSLIRVGTDGIRKWAEQNNLPREVIDRIEQAERSELVKALRDEIANTRGSGGPSTEFLSNAAKLGASYLRQGVRDFQAWSKKMLADVGEAIRPHLQELWAKIKNSDFVKDERGFLSFGKGEKKTTEPVSNARLRRIYEANQGKRGQPSPRKTSVQQAFNDAMADAASGAYYERPVERDTPYFQRKLNDIRSLRRDWSKMTRTERIAEIVGLPKSLKSAIDVSAPGRQGIWGVVTHPFLSARAAGKMMQALVASKATYQQMQAALEAHPDFALAKESGTEFTDVSNEASIMNREEAFHSRLANIVPGVRGSNQAYATFLNWQRLLMFSRWADIGRKAGYTPDANAKFFSDAASVANIATGRGAIPKSIENTPIHSLLNSALWSPKFVASRFQLLDKMYDPISYKRLDPKMRKIMAVEALKFTATIAATFVAAKALGAKVTDDPDDADFGKVVIGKTHYDLTGGLQGAARFLYGFSQTAYKRVAGDIVPDGKDEVSLFIKFARGKLSPLPSMAADFWTKKDYAGRPVERNLSTAASKTASLFIPMVMSDLYEGIAQDGLRGGAMALPTVAGVGVGTYEPKAQLSGDAKAVHDAYRAANPLPPMTPLQKTRFDAKKEIEGAIQRGDPHTSDIIKRNVDDGLINDDEVFDIAAAAHKSSEEKMVDEFKRTPSVERKLDVFIKLSKATRDKLREELEDSWADSAAKMTPHERAVLGPRVGQALGVQ